MLSIANISSSPRVIAPKKKPQRKVITRKEAESRLRELSPESNEYGQLQDALIRGTLGIKEIDIPEGRYKIDTSFGGLLLGGFGSSEHIDIGMEIELKGIGQGRVLIVNGKAKVTFEHIVALAGDFYGIPNEAISLPGGNSRTKTKRFEKAFETLFTASPDELTNIIQEIEEEYRTVKDSPMPRHCYSSQMIEKNNQIKKIKGDIDDLLIDNSDHFEKNAVDAYQIGHQLALKTAAEAGKTQDVKGLKRSYAMDAFACHFLTDLFSSGHIRNQRGELELFLINKLGFDPQKAKLLSGILTGAQHEKDGKDGLLVMNDSGERWQAYGDGYLFLPMSKDNRRKVIYATQLSVDEVYQSYLKCEAPEQSCVYSLIPKTEDINKKPLYKIEEEKLFLNTEAGQIEINSKSTYLRNAVSLALENLPESYITGFILSKIDINAPVIISKVVMPVVDRITGFAWRSIGLSSHTHVKEAHQVLNSKLDDMAYILKATYEIGQQILTITKEIKDTVDRIEVGQKWNTEYGEIREYISSILDCLYQISHNQVVDPSDLREYSDKMKSAYDRLSRVLTEGTTTKTNLVSAYRELVLAQRVDNNRKTDIVATLWYRNLIDLQVSAYSIYLANKIVNEKADQISVNGLRSKFEDNLDTQIGVNIGYVDKVLIYQPIKYILIQYDNISRKQTAFDAYLNLEKEGAKQ